MFEYRQENIRAPHKGAIKVILEENQLTILMHI